MLTPIFRSTSFLGHDTGEHVEIPARIQAIDDALEHAGLLKGRSQPLFAAIELQKAVSVHEQRYLDAIQRFSDSGGGWLDGDTYCGPDSLEVARLAAGAAVAAVDCVLDGSSASAFALGRPPGHHATPLRGMGFCLLNSIAIAAAQARERGLERVAILDWDVHHGNGTQDIFYGRSDVLFASVHQYGGFYPGTGAADERGTGDGEGFTLNVPLRAGAGDDVYASVFNDTFRPAVLEFEPELILVSAGFDAHRDDPLGGMRVTDDGFAALTHSVIEMANELGHNRTAFVLEGGYNLAALGRSVVSVLNVLDNAEGGFASVDGAADR